MFLEYNKSKVAYQESGQGSTLLLLHGFCEDSTMWADFVPFLSKKYHVMTIDLSGFGDSDLLDVHSIDEMAKAVHAVLEQKGIKKCVLIGHSMGGYVGLSFVEQFPEMLSGLGLFHSHPYTDSDEKIENRKKTVRFIERHGIAPFAGQFVRNLFGSTFLEQNPIFVEDLIHKTSMCHSDAVIGASHAMINRRDKTTVLKNITCPVLFIVGMQDNAIQLENSLHQLSLPSIASVHLLEEVGHLGMFEAPEKTLKMLEDFMELCNGF